MNSGKPLLIVVNIPNRSAVQYDQLILGDTCSFDHLWFSFLTDHRKTGTGSGKEGATLAGTEYIE